MLRCLQIKDFIFIYLMIILYLKTIVELMPSLNTLEMKSLN